MRKIQTLVVVFLALFVSFIYSAESVEAHATVVKSEPSSEASLETSPTSITIWFSEPIEERFSSIQVLNSQNEQVDQNDTILNPTEPTVLNVSVDDLPEGVYLVIWENLSVVDGHKVRGSFTFGVGDVEVFSNTFEQVSTPFVQSFASPIIRWVLALGVGISFGALFFEAFVLPEFSKTRSRAYLRAVSHLTILGLLSALVAKVGQILVQLFTIGSSQGSDFFADFANVLVSTQWGYVWIAQFVLILFVLNRVFVHRWRANQNPITSTTLGQIALVISWLVLVANSYTSHSAALGAEVATAGVINDVLHFTFASIWVGGVVSLAYTMVFNFGIVKDTLGLVVKKFTPVAIVSVVGVTLSGLISAWILVGEVQNLNTPYGYFLIAKGGLVLALIVLALLNSLFLVKWIRKKQKRFFGTKRLIAIESVFFVFVFVIVGWLVSIEPAEQYAESNRDESILEVLHEGGDRSLDVSTKLTIDKKTVLGANISIQTSGSSGDSVSAVGSRVRYLDEDLFEPFLFLEKSGDSWVQEGAVVALDGLYQVEVLLVRNDGSDTNISFRFDTSSGLISGGQSKGLMMWQLVGGEVFIVGIAWLLVGLPKSFRSKLSSISKKKRLKSLFVSYATLIILVGVLIFANSFWPKVGLVRNAFNPIPLSGESVEFGRAVYLDNCSICHGEGGLGDGRFATSLFVAPANLVVHAPIHSDGDLYEIVLNGVRDSGMPGFKGALSEEEIWHLVNYLRNLSRSNFIGN